VVNKKKQRKDEQCPTCGHCPTCGRPGQVAAPYVYPVPVLPWWQQYPQIMWTAPGPTCGGNYAGISSDVPTYALTWTSSALHDALGAKPE
jgi:hypothetical protein